MIRKLRGFALTVGMFTQYWIDNPLAFALLKRARPVVVTDNNFATEVEASPFPVLLDLWAPWCGPFTASHFDVRNIPTLLLLKNGREVGRIVGAQSKADILRRIQTLLWGIDEFRIESADAPSPFD